MHDDWAWLFDIGSTFTKVIAVNLTDPRSRYRGESPTTIHRGVRHGVESAIKSIESQENAPRFDRAKHRYGASSAAGGLSMAVCGLVPRMSMEAGRLVALGAGARPVATTSHRISKSEVRKLEALGPDVLLLVGGIDGGDRTSILENARVLAGSSLDAYFVVAGNKEVNEEAAELLQAQGKEAIYTDNVMPELDRVFPDAARAAIRELFIENIIYAKGIGTVAQMFDHPIVPTPSAVLRGVDFLANSVLKSSVLAVEVGGATTDVHSFLVEEEGTEGRIRRGLSEPTLKRTVEGDLGVRWNAGNLVEVSGADWCELHGHSHLHGDLKTYAEHLELYPHSLPEDDVSRELDLCLAQIALAESLARHCGWLETRTVVDGRVEVQYGRDFRDLDVLIGSGGVFSHNRDAGRVAELVDLQSKYPERLLPIDPRVMIDREYLLCSIGLLADDHPEVANGLANAAYAEV